MPPKGKEVKKGGPTGNYKAGKPLKDILPPNSKPPREGIPLNSEIQPDVNRSYIYEPQQNIPEWPGNEEAKINDFTKDSHKADENSHPKFTDNTKIFLPQSYADFEKNEILWLRPEEYLKEIAYDNEVQKRRMEKKLLNRKMRSLRKQSMLTLGSHTSHNEMQTLSKAEKSLENEPPINRDEITYEMLCIAYDERLETEEEVKKRKEEAEKLAAADKNAKKKPPPAKGAPVQADPLDEPQVLKVPVENNMDMGFLMPVYSKWVTSQFQFIKDRSIRDVDSKESIWQRIYP